MPTPWPILLMVRKLDIGGCERDLTKIVTGIDRSRFEPHVGTFRPEGLRVEELKAAGIPIAHFPVMSFVSRGAIEGAVQMGRYIREHGIQLVHPFDVPTVIFGVPVARFFRVPVVIASQLSYRDQYLSREWHLLRLADRMVDALVVNSQAVGRHMQEDEKVNPDLLYLCYNGVDTKVFYPKPIPRPPSIAGASVVIGAVVNLRPEKGLDILLAAYARMCKRHTGTKLLLVGFGPIGDQLVAQARELGITDDCVFEDGRSDVSDWMRVIDIFVLPSRSESFSNALLEAMASGCCVVGSRVGGTPELIHEGETGLLFDSGDVVGLAQCLDQLAGREALRTRLAEAAYRFSRRQLTIERSMDRMSALYTSLLQGEEIPQESQSLVTES
jgi:glycosyltransferase involved in cell wall biosynthesis